jgi:hypothetical protein
MGRILVLQKSAAVFGDWREKDGRSAEDPAIVRIVSASGRGQAF